MRTYKITLPGGNHSHGLIPLRGLGGTWGLGGGLGGDLGGLGGNLGTPTPPTPTPLPGLAAHTPPSSQWWDPRSHAFLSSFWPESSQDPQYRPGGQCERSINNGFLP